MRVVGKKKGVVSINSVSVVRGWLNEPTNDLSGSRASRRQKILGPRRGWGAPKLLPMHILESIQLLLVLGVLYLKVTAPLWDGISIDTRPPHPPPP